MQPPDTEPTTVPSSHNAMMEPMGRGDEPQVRTTVANKARRPAKRQSRKARSTTRSRFSITETQFKLPCVVVDQNIRQRNGFAAARTYIESYYVQYMRFLPGRHFSCPREHCVYTVALANWLD